MNLLREDSLLVAQMLQKVIQQTSRLKLQRKYLHAAVTNIRIYKTGLTVLEKNYLEVYPFETWSNSYLPDFKEGERYEPSRLSMSAGKT